MNKIVRISSVPREGYPNSGLLSNFFNDTNNDIVWAIPSKAKALDGNNNTVFSFLETTLLVKLLPIRLIRLFFLVEVLIRMLFSRKKNAYFIHSFIYSIPAFIANKSFVIFFHGTDNRYLKYSIFRLIVKKSYKAYGIGFGGEFGKCQVTQTKNIINPIVVTPLQPKERTIVFVLRNQKVKNPFYPLRLAEHLEPDLNANIKVVGVSEEELSSFDRDRYFDLNQKGIDISYLGRLNYKKLIDIMNRSSVFILPSFSEGIPKALIESMNLGLNVLINEDLNLPKEIYEASDKFSLDDFHNTALKIKNLLSRGFNEANLEFAQNYLEKSNEELHAQNNRIKIEMLGEQVV